ncbi:PREDICTED: serine/threonine-protein kinase CTR1-like isoform X1 [Lupinus angustifolius]|uniref:serine/threonine-protein kinase CTR1-like isoform X1 n=1 Tax=Lupinus angustifolius TaxID=3871 RepID=UPI00092F7728|nr:PREDICTED: serine/threonine-protein kinase CTR1-like isoform X1 [Lupinus angustifolius]
MYSTNNTITPSESGNSKLQMTIEDEQHQQGEGGSFKSWAKQTEESYQLQLALALRLSSHSSSAKDPNFLEFDSASNSSSISPQSLSHRFWVNGCLQYSDRVIDGFYLIHGMDAYTWTISTDMQNVGTIPSFESLMSVEPGDDSSIVVIAFDKSRDSGLRELQSRVLSLSSNWITTKDATDQLANIVYSRMGGGSSTEENLCTGWKECIQILKSCMHSVILPIGSLPVGLCVHRALLFKVLADLINLPCRIAKGCKYCRKDIGASCIVKFGSDREYIIDLVGMPGTLSQPDSSLNSASSMLIYSPLCHPKFKPVETAEYTKTFAQLYFLDSQALHLVFDTTSGGAVHHSDRMDVQRTEAFSANYAVRNNHLTVFSKSPTTEAYVSFNEANQSVMDYPSHEVDLDEEDLDIRWSELILKENIGTGSFGTVLRADWRGSDVAVKILKVQGFDAERFEEFKKEVSLMKRLRHPNIVLLMGAVIQPPKLSIVTEYLSRGSLYELLQIQGIGSSLNEKCRLRMAYDVASGMNYLHQMRPPIVHRDLKSPNLLVDDTYTVKVCDFGLSRTKANTYLSSKTAAGTPEWMAPEVIRGELSNEKCDVFSFGVILWELVTLQQPWRQFNPSQVVAAVGFMGKRLEIPSHANPRVAALIELCWDTEPWRRPSFSNIMKCLQNIIADTEG